MKELCFLLALSVCSHAASAQIKKESVLLGGQIFYNRNTDNSGITPSKSTNVTFLVSAGTAIKENKVLGLNISYSPVRRFNLPYGANNYTVKNDAYQFGVFYRQYKKPAKDFYFFGEGDLGFATSKQSENYQSSANLIKLTQRTVSASFTPGISYQVLRKLQVELLVPSLLDISYSKRKVYSGTNPVRRSEDDSFTSATRLTNNGQLGFFAVGFRFVL